MKSLRAVLGVVVVAIGIYLAWKLVPPYFNNYQFEDAITEEARLSTYAPNKSEQDIRDIVYKKAQDLELPIKPEQIKVQRTANSVSITVDYTVHVDLPAYPLDLDFHPASKNRMY